ncbi:hypothetical protein ACHAXA_004359 [Cyclostephanos tholiformis]|uniref:Protein kinase domain-containing protein n=1 Tax=Cyclostephanos tholiformis TaxID=382380 RepID=A0ABD3SQI4_9STRA
MALCALNIPEVWCRSNAAANTRRQKIHPHLAGLGDGNIDAQQGLRGSGNKRMRNGRKGGDRKDHLQPPLSGDESGHPPGKDFRPRLDLDDIDVMDLMRKGALAHTMQEIEGSNQPLAPDGPWQLSVLILLGILGILLGLFIHFSPDPNANSSYLRRRAKKKNSFISPPSYKKKTDDWSEDEELTKDDIYMGDAEGGVGGTDGKQRSTMIKSLTDPAATMYYHSPNMPSNYRLQDHRIRKLVIQQTPNDTNIWAGGGSFRPESTNPVFLTPHRQSKLTVSGNSNRTADKASRSPFRTPLKADTIGIGSGLEGFTGDSSLSSDATLTSSRCRDVDTVNVHPLVKPMGKFIPTQSFESLAIVQNSSTVPLNNDSVGVDSNTPSSLQSGHNRNQCYEDLTELTTPRIDHTRGKRDLSRDFKRDFQKITGPPLVSANTQQNGINNQNASRLKSGVNAEPDSTVDIHDLPFIPNLNDLTVENFRSLDSDAPHSILLEELQLVRMESGVQEPSWSTKFDLAQSQESKNIEKLREAASTSADHHDPRNNIQHIRKDLTISSDASSSLSSIIPFSELNLEDVIGGGGFGQVWRARWKGTPVAVKVLTGSAQTETVPKAILEEFIAEINMLSGMRHPNICLFMGACLDPPNRAIVTELCENGSLWDALRSPLSIYEVADGETRLAWPLDLYYPITPTFHPPLAPAGAWPWALVKRVASGTARGMCYLHSGNPPVLHRDLKSANILLDLSFTAKLADFGLSRLKAVRSGMTGNCGTVQWMAPEVLCSEKYAEPADVFSFGIILWEMLTKECPYDGMTPIQCALTVLNQNKRPEIPEWCPQSFRVLINRCVERDPLSRPTFAEILAALDE